MPVINVSERFYERLLSKVKSFDDTPETVMNRLMDESEEKTALLENNATDNRDVIQRVETTPEMLKETYRLAKDVVENGADLNNALDYLETDIGMNRVSAGMFINAFKAMRAGERYTRALSNPATIYFLEHIFADYGKSGLIKALDSVWKHIEYQEDFLSGGKKEGTREIHKKFSAKLERNDRRPITIIEIKEIYKKAREVFRAFEKDARQGRKETNNALDYLEQEIGMNRGSAYIYIKVFLAMKEGSIDKTKMTINDVATEYFLEKIYEEDGEEGLRTALDTVWKNINYYEGVTKQKYGRKNTRKIHAEFSAKLTQ